SEEELIEVFNERAYDVILLGSDAVFHLSARDLTEDLRFPNPFWLLWVDERLAGSPFRAVLAASSMGTQFFRLPKPTRAGVRRAWQRMEFLSVRDQWTRWSVAFLTRGRLWPRLCPDPTSVLNDVLDRAAEDDAEAASLDGRYILLSLPAVALREDWLDALVREAHALGYLVFGLALPEGDCPQGVDRVIGHPLDPLAWYAWIRHAAGVIATRFHPAVCSIFNGVPLVSLDYGVWFPKGLVEIRIPSKTYDVCRRAGTRRACLTPRQLRRLAPADVLGLLEVQRRTRTLTYAARAREEFRRTVAALLRAAEQSRRGHHSHASAAVASRRVAEGQ
ncbi:MAG: polysaccharide pyruvyl transferase family protein, partial [Phycisphaerae bacterium]